VTKWFGVLAVAAALSFVASVSADENVRAVQVKLRDGGFYSGEIDGAYSSQFAAALTRYQIRNGLLITGQLDAETSKALDAKPAVTTKAADPAQSSETWRQLRKSGVTKSSSREASSATPADSASAAPAATAQPETHPVAPPPTQTETAAPASTATVTTDRLRDYVAAFVLAGLDPRVGAETDFFADRVQYYGDGVIGREKIRQDLQRYAARWPERKFWLAGDIAVGPQSGNRVRVTFPLRYDLRNGSKHSAGKIDKTLVLQPVGDDYEIVAVTERKAQ
jgi:peptidoglycan hydrolase-like protein with peptidoglycan-binding domain